MKVAIVPVTAYQQNCSILLCEQTGKVAVVDPGGDTDRILEQVDRWQGSLALILLTHGHLDHCSAARQLADAAQVPLWGPHRADNFWLEQLPQLCDMMGFPPTAAFTPDRWLEHGEAVRFGEQVLQVIHAPGHTPGHLVFYHEGDRLAFVGDVLFQGSIGRTDFPQGDFDTLICSIREKLFPLGDDVRFVPGHGPMSTLGHERDTNPFVSGRWR